MKEFIKKSKVCFLVVILFIALVVLVPVVIGCSASAQCPGGAVAWCETFGHCDESSCVGIDGVGASCICDEAADVFECPPEA